LVVSAVAVIPIVVLFPESMDGTSIDGSTAAGAWLIALSQLLFYAGMVFWPLLVGTVKGDGWRRSFGFVASWRAVWIGAAGGVVTLVTMVVLTNITADLLNRDINSAGAEVAETMTGNAVAYALFLALIAFGAPFVEEISFRGLIWGAVAKRGWSPWLATVVAAVPFALIHFEPIRIAALLAAGLLLGVIRQFGGLGASMLAHAVVNVIGVIGILTV
jgi:membrane protease YdiL (CAAX protease family)